jgi:decaprenylphospho-beta-D-ribofuranose 2-oxidase
MVWVAEGDSPDVITHQPAFGKHDVNSTFSSSSSNSVGPNRRDDTERSRMTQWADRELSGWGRYPVQRAECARPATRSDLRQALVDRDGHSILAHAAGRSYGDAALNERGRAILTERLDRMLDFDPQKGWLRVEAGVTLKEIIDVFLPRGWFPTVVPGTQYVTVGGAVGCNIHGKNHHQVGSFGDHVRRLEMLTASGEIVTCDRETRPELFWATVGGMGLTGIILSLELKLEPVAGPAIEMESIRVENLDEFFEVSAQSGGFTHTVSWIDCVASGSNMGRGVFMRGRHAGEDVDWSPGPMEKLAETLKSAADGRPFESNWLLNRATMRIGNAAYFHKEPKGKTERVVHYEPFFFPLDAIDHWNHIYGSRGFLQYQCVVPEREAIREILEEVTATSMASFLSVIKEFGPRTHTGLSFPEPGITLALDFPNFGEPLMELLDRLDAIVATAGGRVYLGKDARLDKQSFRKMYPEWEAWREVRDEWDPEGVFQSSLGRRLGLVKGG